MDVRLGFCLSAVEVKHLFLEAHIPARRGWRAAPDTGRRRNVATGGLKPPEATDDSAQLSCYYSQQLKKRQGGATVESAEVCRHGGGTGLISQGSDSFVAFKMMIIKKTRSRAQQRGIITHPRFTT